MNASTNFNTDTLQDSDSDTNSDETTPDYYQPISSSDPTNDELDPNHNNNINGYHHHHHHEMDDHHYSGVENGVRSLDLSGDGNDDDDGGDDDEERRRGEMESAMRRAFEEDESRRSTPLSSENATRVMEAMRGVSFSGSAPDWIRRVPEDRWVHQLQRLRHPGSTA